MHFTVHAHYLQAFRKTSVVNSFFFPVLFPVFLICHHWHLPAVRRSYQRWFTRPQKTSKTAAGCGPEKKKTAMFHSDEVRVSLVRRRNEPRLQRAKLRFPPIKTRNHRLTPTIVKRQLCLQGSALTRRWTLIACLQLIVRALITSDKEKHKSQGEAWPTAGPGRLVGGETLGGWLRAAKISLRLCLDKEPAASLILLGRPLSYTLALFCVFGWKQPENDTKSATDSLMLSNNQRWKYQQYPLGVALNLLVWCGSFCFARTNQKSDWQWI